MSILKAGLGIVFSHVSLESKTGTSNWKSYRAQLVITNEWSNGMVHVQPLSFVQLFATPRIKGTPGGRLLYPWDFPGKDTEVAWHFLVPTQGLNLHLLCWQLDSLPLRHQGSHQRSPCWNGGDRDTQNHRAHVQEAAVTQAYTNSDLQNIIPCCQILTFSKRH